MAVTRFVQEYDAPWLYRLAALSAAGRVAGREHFVSDTVAGGMAGYVIGNWLWNSQRANRGAFLSLNPTPKAANVTVRGTY